MTEVVVDVIQPTSIQVDADNNPEVDVVVGLPVSVQVGVGIVGSAQVAVAPPAEVEVDVSDLGMVGPQGDQGPPGPTGERGPAGFGSNNITYTHIQNAPSNTWTITHNLGYVPNVTVFDSGGNEVDGDITIISDNILELHFSSAFAGIAYLS